MTRTCYTKKRMMNVMFSIRQFLYQGEIVLKIEIKNKQVPPV